MTILDRVQYISHRAEALFLSSISDFLFSKFNFFAAKFQRSSPEESSADLHKQLNSALLTIKPKSAQTDQAAKPNAARIFWSRAGILDLRRAAPKSLSPPASLLRAKRSESRLFSGNSHHDRCALHASSREQKKQTEHSETAVKRLRKSSPMLRKRGRYVPSAFLPDGMAIRTHASPLFDVLKIEVSLDDAEGAMLERWEVRRTPAQIKRAAEKLLRFREFADLRDPMSEQAVNEWLKAVIMLWNRPRSETSSPGITKSLAKLRSRRRNLICKEDERVHAASTVLEDLLFDKEKIGSAPRSLHDLVRAQMELELALECAKREQFMKRRNSEIMRLAEKLETVEVNRRRTDLDLSLDLNEDEAFEPGKTPVQSLRVGSGFKNLIQLRQKTERLRSTTFSKIRFSDLKRNRGHNRCKSSPGSHEQLVRPDRERQVNWRSDVMFSEEDTEQREESIVPRARQESEASVISCGSEFHHFRFSKQKPELPSDLGLFDFEEEIEDDELCCDSDDVYSTDEDDAVAMYEDDCLMMETINESKFEEGDVGEDCEMVIGANGDENEHDFDDAELVELFEEAQSLRLSNRSPPPVMDAFIGHSIDYEITQSAPEGKPGNFALFKVTVAFGTDAESSESIPSHDSVHEDRWTPISVPDAPDYRDDFLQNQNLYTDQVLSGAVSSFMSESALMRTQQIGS